MIFEKLIQWVLRWQMAVKGHADGFRKKMDLPINIKTCNKSLRGIANRLKYSDNFKVNREEQEDEDVNSFAL